MVVSVLVLGKIKVMKLCKKCQILKSKVEFYKHPAALDGLRGWCKSCESIRSKEWKDKYSDFCKLRRREWYYKHREREKSKSLMRRNSHKEEYIKAARQWKKNNPERVKEYKREWSLKNPTKAKEARKRKRNRYFSTSQGVLNHRMGCGLRHALCKTKNFRPWTTLLGYNVFHLKKHLESKFSEGMNWDLFKQGKIHIDHIIPLSRLYISSVDDPTFKFAWSLGNLRPLWAEDNLRKGNKILQAS